MRHSSKTAQAAFERILNDLGKRQARDHRDVGGWQLGSVPGGYQIQEIGNEHGGVHIPMMHEPLTAREVYELAQHVRYVRWVREADEREQGTTDKTALDRIAGVLREESWSADTLDSIAYHVRMTGRMVE